MIDANSVPRPVGLREQLLQERERLARDADAIAGERKLVELRLATLPARWTLLVQKLVQSVDAGATTMDPKGPILQLPVTEEGGDFAWDEGRATISLGRSIVVRATLERSVPYGEGWRVEHHPTELCVFTHETTLELKLPNNQSDPEWSYRVKLTSADDPKF